MVSAVPSKGKPSVQSLSPKIRQEEEIESRPLPAIEDRIACVQERFQEKF